MLSKFYAQIQLAQRRFLSVFVDEGCFALCSRGGKSSQVASKDLHWR